MSENPIKREKVDKMLRSIKFYQWAHINLDTPEEERLYMPLSSTKDGFYFVVNVRLKDSMFLFQYHNPKGLACLETERIGPITDKNLFMTNKDRFEEEAKHMHKYYQVGKWAK